MNKLFQKLLDYFFPKKHEYMKIAEFKIDNKYDCEFDIKFSHFYEVMNSLTTIEVFECKHCKETLQATKIEIQRLPYGFANCKGKSGSRMAFSSWDSKWHDCLSKDWDKEFVKASNVKYVNFSSKNK